MGREGGRGRKGGGGGGGGGGEGGGREGGGEGERGREGEERGEGGRGERGGEGGEGGGGGGGEGGGGGGGGERTELGDRCRGTRIQPQPRSWPRQSSRPAARLEDVDATRALSLSGLARVFDTCGMGHACSSAGSRRGCGGGADDCGSSNPGVSREGCGCPLAEQSQQPRTGRAAAQDHSRVCPRPEGSANDQVGVPLPGCLHGTVGVRNPPLRILGPPDVFAEAGPLPRLVDAPGCGR